MLDNLGLLHMVIIVVLLVPYVASIWAIVVTARETTIPLIAVALWALVMLLLPYVGVIAWVFWWNISKPNRAKPRT